MYTKLFFLFIIIIIINAILIFYYFFFHLTGTFIYTKLDTVVTKEMNGFGDFNADELMASLEASSTPVLSSETKKLLNPNMVCDADADLALEELLSHAEGKHRRGPSCPIDLDTSSPRKKPAQLSRYVINIYFFNFFLFYSWEYLCF